MSDAKSSNPSVHIITLVHPIDDLLAGPDSPTKITELQIRRPKGKDYRAMKSTTGGGPFAMILDLAAQLSGQPTQVFDAMDGVDDLPKVIEVVGRFLENFPDLGKT